MEQGSSALSQDLGLKGWRPERSGSASQGSWREGVSGQKWEKHPSLRPVLSKGAGG